MTEPQESDYWAVKALLEQNPRLKYINETEDHYTVQSSEQLSLIVPKGRTAQEASSDGRPRRFRPVYRWLGLAALGLLPSGLGAIVFAPLAGLSALRLSFSPLSRTERIHSLVLILLSGSLWLCGLLLSIILLAHLT